MDERFFSDRYTRFQLYAAYNMGQVSFRKTDPLNYVAGNPYNFFDSDYNK
jgi:hypothetical protein